MEIWKDVKNYEGCYQISNHGRIKSMKRKVRSRGGFRELPEKIVQPLYSKNGYLNVVASKEQIRSTLIVHQLVAEYFIGKRPEGLVIDHIDGNKTNNHVSNLRYVTTKENLRKRHDRKLDEKKVLEILELVGKMPQSQIAKLFGVTQSLISRIKQRKAWANG